MRIVCLALILVTAGCLPSTRVVKNPCDRDRGIRYYRPKPYLFVQPHKDEESGRPSDKYVDIELQMLPDFSEEYSIHVRSGLGTNDTSITLNDGWNLTEIDVDVDSQFDENFAAVAEGLSRFIPTETVDGGRTDKRFGNHVAARNVPLGYYESVIARGPDGKKRMYGWRYVGFSPYAYCPQQAGGLECQPDCHQRPLYGMVFFDGAMTFMPLDDIRQVTVTNPRSNLEKALGFLENEIARTVPAILDDVGIVEVPAKNIDVVIDTATETIDVNAVLNEAQLTAYKNADVTPFELSQSIVAAVERRTGQALNLTFRVTPLAR